MKDISFAFSRLTDANRTAIFTQDRKGEGDEIDGRFEAFQSRQQSISRDELALLPKHVIRFHNKMLINDTELHIMGVNAATAEISIDWCSLFTAFFSDTRLYHNNLRNEWSKRRPNSSCWDSWDPALAKHSKYSSDTSFVRENILDADDDYYTVAQVRHECAMVGFHDAADLNVESAASLLKSYSEMNAAARIRARRKRMKQQLERLAWRDGVRRYFKNELFAIEMTDPDWNFCDMELPAGCGAQKWVTLRYSNQPEQVRRRESWEDEDTD